MAYEITIENGLMLIRLHGNQTNAGLIALAREMAQLEAKSPVAVHRLTDMRGCSGVELNFHGMLTFGQARTGSPLRNQVKSAVIAPDPILYGFARMFQMLNANPSITVAIFPTEESALAWLLEPGVVPPQTAWAPDGPIPS